MNVSVVPTTRVIGPSSMCARSTAVAHQVRRHAVAALVDEEPPRQHAERVAPVHREEAAAVVRDLAEHAVGDQLPRVLHERRPAVVVPTPEITPRAAASARVVCAGVPPTGFSQNTCLPAARRRLDQLDVQHVRRGYPHHVHVVGVHHLAPVLGRALEPERAHRLLAALRAAGPRKHHEPRVERALGEQREGIRSSDRACAWPSQPNPITPTPIVRAVARARARPAPRRPTSA